MRNEWVPPVAFEEFSGRLSVHADGEVRHDPNVILTEEEYRLMRQGYVCCRCHGRQQNAFPENCGFPGCDGYPEGFPMRERQIEVMDREFDGYSWVGPSRQLWERMNAPVEPKTRMKSGIWVPGRD